MARKKKRSNERPNSAMMVVRVHKETRAGIERVAAARGESMSLQVDRASQRWIKHNEHPHLGNIADRIIMLALDIEKRTGKTITKDPDTADAFAASVQELLKRHTAATQQPSESSKTLAWLSLNVVGALANAGVDWSDDALSQAATTQSVIKGSW